MGISKAAFAIIVLCFFASNAWAYVTSIHAVAEIENQNIGNLTVVKLNVTPGNGAVQLTGPASVDKDTLDSAKTAAAYAASYLGLNESKYNFNYTIEDKNFSVSGPSGGLALTLLAVAGLQHKQLANNFAATGTISANGTVGLVGGLYDKIGASKAGGMSFILVPYSPSKYFEYLLYYISQQVRGIPVVEVANISQAIPYAFGSANPKFLAANFSESYNLGASGSANVTCVNCNTSAFTELVNATFNFSTAAINGISGNFSAAKRQLLDNTRAYQSLVSDGYLYSGADLQFLDYSDIFTLSNTRNFTTAGASRVLSNISSYCSSLVAPPLTTANYEFVVGGTLRQYWASMSLTAARSLLSSEQTSDDVIRSLNLAAPALGWCKASDQLFRIASQTGGYYVSVSPQLKATAATAINNARSYGNSTYYQSALQAYSNGDYPTALYAATYASTISQNAPNVSESALYATAYKNIANSTYGIWPSQFAAQSEFYIRESVASSGSLSKVYAGNAYSISKLAAGLAKANMEINSSLSASNVSVSGTSPQVEQQISGIEDKISQIYEIMLINVFLLFGVLLVLIFHLLPKKPEAPKRARR